MRPSEVGVSLIKVYESLALEAYPDPVSPLAKQAFAAGVHYTKIPGWRVIDGTPWTVGWGHTGADVTPGLQITEERAEQLFRYDLRLAETTVTEATLGLSLTQGQLDALVSFVFNEGGKAFRGSTLLAKLRAGDVQGAANEFLRWTFAGKPKRSVPGLERRRAAERTMFLGEV